jgi:hypothetical protein
MSVDIKLHREMHQIVAGMIAISANDDRKKEKQLVDAYSRVLDSIHQKSRDRREQLEDRRHARC